MGGVQCSWQGKSGERGARALFFREMFRAYEGAVSTAVRAVVRADDLCGPAEPPAALADLGQAVLQQMLPMSLLKRESGKFLFVPKNWGTQVVGGELLVKTNDTGGTERGLTHDIGRCRI